MPVLCRGSPPPMVPGTVSQTFSSKSTMSAGSHCSSFARALSSAGWCGGCGSASCNPNPYMCEHVRGMQL